MSNESEDTKNLNPAQASEIADDKDINPAGKSNAKPDAVAPVSTAEARSEPSPKPAYLTKFPFKFKGRPDGFTGGSQTASSAIKNGTDKPGTKLK
ncbi:hypothetical protein PILCRDRAFT_816003 [Piloderma croceum F 1598]|uniref:Uncharacterized protein n=1 Tax=Piloderma croceum (strain F 1598) TaxID=765440 RepID=A0A0C3BK63_PILCF|nr:hypothetical protein PILCRDRAFT_816003 [Piloderma croceum F 1598]